MKSKASLVVGMLAAVSTFLLSAIGFAGTLTVHDRAGFFAPSDVKALEEKASSWPFDVHLLAENVGGSQLDDDAHKAVTGPSVVAIAIDPARHKTATRFGASTGVKPGDFDSIAAAGNAHFRSGDKIGAVEAIVLRARASREAKVAMTSDPGAPVVLHEGLSLGAWLAILFGVSVLAGFVYYLWKKAREDRRSYEQALQENKLETSELLSRNVETMTRPARSPSLSPDGRHVAIGEYERFVSSINRNHPAPPPPAASPVYVAPAPVYVPPSYHDRSSDLLTGMLIGEALAEPRWSYASREVEIIERERVVERDSGGSSSSWDTGNSSYGSGSSSSSSDDSGGSSSSWGSSDSGSSSWGGDSGGGSSDSGGGSSDW